MSTNEYFFENGYDKLEKTVKECNEDSCELLNEVLSEPVREFEFRTFHLSGDIYTLSDPRDLFFNLGIQITSAKFDFSGDNYNKIMELCGEFYNKLIPIIRKDGY